MKKIYGCLLFITLMVSSGGEASQTLFRLAGEIGDVGVKEKQNTLEMLKKEREQLLANKKVVVESIKKRLDEAEQRLNKVKEELKENRDSEFLLKTQSVLSDLIQSLRKEQEARDAIISRIDDRMNAIDEYLNDMRFEQLKQELKVDETTIYSFDYAQLLHKKIVNQQKIIDALVDQEKNTLSQIENRKKLLNSMVEAHKKRQEEFEMSANFTSGQDSLGLNLRQKGDLFALEEKLYEDKKLLEELHLKELEHKLASIKMRLFIARGQLEVLKEALSKTKPFMRMSEASVAYAKDELKDRKKKLFATLEQYQKETDQYIVREDALQDLSKKYSISLARDLDEWTAEPPENTSKSYGNFYELVELNEQVSYAKIARDLIETRKTREELAYSYEELMVDLKETFHKLTARKFVSEEELSKEIKDYAAKRAQLLVQQSEYKSTKADLTTLLESRKKALENIKEHEKDLVAQKEKIFKSNQRDYAVQLKRTQDSEELIKRDIKMLDETIDIYDSLVTKISEAVHQIDFIVSDLEGTKLWHRPEHAITWQDIKNIQPDFERFSHDISVYFSQLKFSYLFNVVRSAFDIPYLIFWLFILLLLFLFLLMFKRYVPNISKGLVEASQSYRGLRMISLPFSLFAGFFAEYFVSISTWLMLYMTGKLFKFSDPYFYVIFYLLSIPYFIYLLNRFMRYLARFNESRGYLFLSASFQSRFITVSSFFLYATSIIILFREAFLLVDYTKSGLPAILLALNIIILQVSLILIIDKEHLLRFIPTRTPFWEWIYRQVDRYYYLIIAILIPIIILANPYVGFGRLLWYVISRISFTIVIIYFVFWAHDLLKRISTKLFFQVKDDMARERFSYAKTSYGLFVTVTLLLMIAATIIFVAKIWGWPEALVNIASAQDVKNWVFEPIWGIATENPVSLFSLMKFFFYIVLGMILALSFDRFVLDRIFDVLFVEPGIQHAVSGITRYIIVLITAIVGFQTIGLGTYIWYLVIASGATLGLALKDPIFDFISYFIILIQRPVKIGDYIRFDEDFRGVVRRITPRSVVLRRRNAATVIVPNSQVMTRQFTNWNYSRGFTAFDDIFITVDYKEDPAKVKELLDEVVKANKYVLKSPSPVIRLYRFGAYGYVYQIRGFLSSNYMLDMWDIASEIRLAIAKVLKDNNIEIAGIKAPDMLPGMTMGQQSGVPAEFSEHRISDE